MPEYLAPGVFVEETSFRQKTIEGVSTSTSGFIGPAGFGPVNGEPELLTSYSDFERIYGGMDRVRFEDLSSVTHNYLAHAVRAYFEEGGRRLYVARTFHESDESDGIARWQPEGSLPDYTLRARYPGGAGNFSVTFIFKLGDNALQTQPIDPSIPDGDTFPVLRGVGQFDVVLAGNAGASPSTEDLFWVESFFDEGLNRHSHQLHRLDATEIPPEVILDLDEVDSIQRLTVSVILGPTGLFGNEQSWEDLALHPDHPNSLSHVFDAEPSLRSTELYVPLVFTSSLNNGADIVAALMESINLAGTGTILESFILGGDLPSEASRTFTVLLENGADGNLPTPADYQGSEGLDDGIKTGLSSFEDLEGISIIAAPGSSFNYSVLFQGDSEAVETVEGFPQSIANRLVSHCERMRYRVAVLDSVNANILSEVRNYRSVFDTTRAAFYYPWVRTFDQVTEQYINVPPSGSVSGIYARNDINRGVHKAPANEVVRMASGLEFVLNKAQQEVLNPLGVNCLRFFDGRGYRIWGARTASSDPEWKYLNVRRYFAFLERSIEIGTQWAVFENNGVVLWDNVRSTIEDFLFNEWRQDHLAGTSPNQAFFVRCDRTTMTQNDLDNGRMICLIGVAPLRPAEFVIFRIGQKTAESR